MELYKPNEYAFFFFQSIQVFHREACLVPNPNEQQHFKKKKAQKAQIWGQWHLFPKGDLIVGSWTWYEKRWKEAGLATKSWSQPVGIWGKYKTDLGERESSVQFSRSVVSDSWRPHGLQHVMSITNSHSLLKLISIESVMPSNHLILCCPLLLPTSTFPSIRVFSNELVLCIR